jgi:hypothetical protein
MLVIGTVGAGGRLRSQTVATGANESATITGYVRSSNGDPIRGAAITLRPSSPEFVLEEPRLAESGDDGGFAIPNVPPGLYRITSVSKPGFAALVAPIPISVQGSEQKTDVVITLAPQGVFGGRLNDVYGELLVGTPSLHIA